MDYEKKYNELVEVIKQLQETNPSDESIQNWANDVLYGTKEANDERIRKAIKKALQVRCDGSRIISDEPVTLEEAISWLEKQKPIEHFELKAGHWYICHRPFCCRADHLTVKEGERFMCEKDGVVKGFVIKDAEKYFKECNAPAPYEDEQKPKMITPEESLGISSEEYNKIVDECIFDEQKLSKWSVEDEQNLNACLSYISDEFLRRWLKDVIHIKYDKPANKVEPNFKVKYAGSEYNVFEVKDIAGVTYYGIEDEPNHIDYVQAENCEIVSEQKPTDKVEPKFHVRDWVVTDKGYTVQIAAVNSCYTINNGMDFSTSYVDKYWRLWTIKDAKPGDVLACKGDIKDSNGIKYERICLFNNLDNAFFTLTKTSNYVETYDIDVNIDYPDNTVPATKEQKEILFIAIKEAGYKWDAENKQLLSLKAEPTKEIKGNNGKISPKWSKEDDIKLNDTINIINDSGYVESLRKPYIDWLKSLKQRLKEQQ